LKKLTLYIVEDDPIQRFVLERMAENLNLHILGSADNGSDAIREILRFEPDLILMDIQLRDGTSGIEVAEKILRSSRPAIIFITANSDLKEQTQLSGLSFHHFISKPVSYHELLNAFDRLGEQSGMKRQKENVKWQTGDNSNTLTFNKQEKREN
jgi:CheY-like chemotaxis protein